VLTATGGVLRQARGMDLDIAHRLADQWQRDSNAHNLEALLCHYSDDVVFTSPVVRQLLPDSGGVLRGKGALRAYWSEGLRRIPDLRFEVEACFVGDDTLVINYRNHVGALVAEVRIFDGDLITTGHGTYLALENPAGAAPQ